jgi:hypothetical protein
MYSEFHVAYYNKNVDLDYILDTGDQIYMKTIQNLKKQGRFKNMLLTFDEIPNVLEICNIIYLHTCIKRVHIPHKIFYITKSNKHRSTGWLYWII